MRTFEDLLNEVEKKNDRLTKTASVDESDTLKLLTGLSQKLEKTASQERIMKYANAAGAEFAKGAASKFEKAAELFVKAVDTDAFAEKVANLIIEKLAVEASEETIHSLSEPTEKENPQTQVVDDQMKQDLSAPSKAEAKKQDLLDAEFVEGADAEGKGDLLSEKSAALEALRELLRSVD